MSFLQVCLREGDHGLSGAEIRNNDNAVHLSALVGGEQIFIDIDRDAERPPSLAATVARLDAAGVAALLTRIREASPQVVLFEGVALLDAMIAVRREWPDLRLIIDFHNIESQLEFEIRRARLPLPLRPAARHLLARRTADCVAADRLAVSLADAVWVCSQEDRARLAEISPGESAAIVANPVPDWCTHVQPPVGMGAEIIYVGHLGYRPNRRAVAELVRTIMPRITRVRPGTVLHVCGRGPRSSTRRLVQRSGARLTESPPDLAPIYARAALTAIPLREGGGTRIKVIEALACGCPVVATAKAVEGLGLEAGREFLAAEKTRDFVGAILALLDDAGLRSRLATSGRNFVAARLGPEARRQAITRAFVASGNSSLG